MIGREFKFHNGKKGAALAIRVIKESEENVIRKVLIDGTVIVHLQGDPIDTKKVLIQYLADELGLDSKRIDIIEGKKGADLLISILDIEPVEIQRLILEKIS